MVNTDQTIQANLKVDVYPNISFGSVNIESNMPIEYGIPPPP